MSDLSKKISFSFSKSTKKTTPLFVAPKENNVQYIDCLEENSIKIIGKDDSVETKPLVIPMKNNNLLRDSMVATIELRKNGQSNEKLLSSGLASDVKTEETKTLTLDEIAAKELLEEATKVDLSSKQESKIFAVPLSTNVEEGHEESTLDDYENIPITDFGLAMLRGMGWKADEGIGKTNAVVKPPSPKLRPKGMGLGADKVIKCPVLNDEELELVIKKGVHVKFIAGAHKHLYGIVEGLDEDTGRVMVKLAIEGIIVSVSEFMVTPISRHDYAKNSNVINSVKYNEYKNRENSQSKSYKENEGNKEDKVECKYEPSNKKDIKKTILSTAKTSVRTEQKESYENISSRSVKKKYSEYENDKKFKHTNRNKEHYKSSSDSSPERKKSTSHRNHGHSSRESHYRHKRKHKRKYRSRSRS